MTVVLIRLVKISVSEETREKKEGKFVVPVRTVCCMSSQLTYALSFLSGTSGSGLEVKPVWKIFQQLH